jgi:hypothetical protein
MCGGVVCEERIYTCTKDVSCPMRWNQVRPIYGQDIAEYDGMRTDGEAVRYEAENTARYDYT